MNCLCCLYCYLVLRTSQNFSYETVWKIAKGVTAVLIAVPGVTVLPYLTSAAAYPKSMLRLPHTYASARLDFEGILAVAGGHLRRGILDPRVPTGPG